MSELRREFSYSNQAQFYSIMHLSAVFTALAFMSLSCTWENDTKRDNITRNFGSCLSHVISGSS